MKYTLFLKFIDMLASVLFTSSLSGGPNSVDPNHIALAVTAANSVSSVTVNHDDRDSFTLARAFFDYYVFMKTTTPPIAGIGLPTPAGKPGVDNSAAD